jgi:hypothetical protein
VTTFRDGYLYRCVSFAAPRGHPSEHAWSEYRILKITAKCVSIAKPRGNGLLRLDRAGFAATARRDKGGIRAS